MNIPDRHARFSQTPHSSASALPGARFGAELFPVRSPLLSRVPSQPTSRDYMLISDKVFCCAILSELKSHCLVRMIRSRLTARGLRHQPCLLLRSSGVAGVHRSADVQTRVRHARSCPGGRSLSNEVASTAPRRVRKKRQLFLALLQASPACHALPPCAGS
jgi:hypothetical protein